MDEGIGDILEIYIWTDFLINFGITFWNIGTSNFLFYVKGKLFMLILFIDGYVIYIINLFRYCLLNWIIYVIIKFDFILNLILFKYLCIKNNLIMLLYL